MTFVTFRIILLILYFALAGVSSSFSQRIIYQHFKTEGAITLAQGIEIPAIDRGYTLWLPENDLPSGLVVFFHSRPDTTESDQLLDLALDKGLAVMYASTENRLEFLFDDASLEEVYQYIYTAVIGHGIPPGNMLFCGMSLEGTRALRMHMYTQKKEEQGIKARAIAVCDAPIDMTRFYRSCIRSARLNYHQAAANEGRWVSEYLQSNLGGPPDSVPSAYISYSPYTHDDVEVNNHSYFLDVAVRAYTEPDVEWWMKNRGKDYYDMNSVDLAAFINRLNLSGNEEAELIITSEKGSLPNGEKHPHSWSIVDEKELISWFTKLISKSNDHD